VFFSVFVVLGLGNGVWVFGEWSIGIKRWEVAIV